MRATPRLAPIHSGTSRKSSQPGLKLPVLSLRAWTLPCSRIVAPSPIIPPAKRRVPKSPSSFLQIHAFGQQISTNLYRLLFLFWELFLICSKDTHLTESTLHNSRTSSSDLRNRPIEPLIDQTILVATHPSTPHGAASVRTTGHGGNNHPTGFQIWAICEWEVELGVLWVPAHLEVELVGRGEGRRLALVKAVLNPPPLPRQPLNAIAKTGETSALRSCMECVADTLPPAYRQSKKLPDDQLKELQRSTNFDKKELQQWYRGGLSSSARRTQTRLKEFKNSDQSRDARNRLPQRLPIGYAHQERVSKDLRSVLPLRRPVHLRRLRIQRVRHRQVRHHRL